MPCLEKRQGTAEARCGAASPTTFSVGLRIGPDLRRQRAAWERAKAEHNGGACASPVPHYRTWYFGHRWIGHGENRTLERRCVSECCPNRFRNFETTVATVAQGSLPQECREVNEV
jgi:hypothetical protein